MLNIIILFLTLCQTFSTSLGQNNSKEQLLLLTVASDRTDGFERYLRSAKVNNLKGKVLGLGQEWQGGQVETDPGGAYKIRLLRDELKDLLITEGQGGSSDDLIVMFTDSYDVVFLGDEAQILEKFKAFKGGPRVIFGAERYCWPNPELASKYPTPSGGSAARFLNSGGFIGYASDLYEIVKGFDGKDTDDDQLFYTRVFLDDKMRTKHKIVLDTMSVIFQNINGVVDDIHLKFEDGDGWPYVENKVSETTPLVIHGNGDSKVSLNSLGNYVPRVWTPKDQCLACLEGMLPVVNAKQPNTFDWATVVLAVFVEYPTPFMEEFFQKVSKLDFPKSQIHLMVHNAVPYHDKDVENFLWMINGNKTNGEDLYASVKVIKSEVSETEARNQGLSLCRDLKCHFYFSLDSVAHIDNPATLKLLIQQNRKVLAPLLVRPNHMWSNFWGALNEKGFYARSSDYMDIVQGIRVGVWNVPYISAAYLINGTLINDQDNDEEENVSLSFVDRDLDPDMAFCSNLRRSGTFLYVTNRLEWGHLVDPDGFPTTHLHNELWEIERNRLDWELRYIQPDYYKQLLQDTPLKEPCPDVFWFPVVTERFADEFVAEMENYGVWSDGSNYDTRLDGGYENVPTRDIHMKQVGYDQQWLKFLETYVSPLQQKAFLGYVSTPPKSTMNFIVRYRPDEQPSLRPHFDSSTYTINLALNRVGVDYEGGGCKFVRQNCSVTSTKKGWLLMHPGRLTHFHEGLPTTKGTRYIMISFVDP